jgi:hypothetical protein
MLMFQVEPLALIWDDFERLARLFADETEKGKPFCLDKDRYIYYNNIGYHRFYTVRNEIAQIVGCVGIYVSKGIHDNISAAREDFFFLMKRYRKGRNAIDFLKFVEQDLVKIGVKYIDMSAKVGSKAARILELRGYEHVSNNYLKEIGL